MNKLYNYELIRINNMKHIRGEIDKILNLEFKGIIIYNSDKVQINNLSDIYFIRYQDNIELENKDYKLRFVDLIKDKEFDKMKFLRKGEIVKLLQDVTKDAEILYPAYNTYYFDDINLSSKNNILIYKNVVNGCDLIFIDYYNKDNINLFYIVCYNDKVFVFQAYDLINMYITLLLYATCFDLNYHYALVMTPLISNVELVLDDINSIENVIKSKYTYTNMCFYTKFNLSRDEVLNILQVYNHYFNGKPMNLDVDYKDILRSLDDQYIYNHLGVFYKYCYDDYIGDQHKFLYTNDIIKYNQFRKYNDRLKRKLSFKTSSTKNNDNKDN